MRPGAGPELRVCRCPRGAAPARDGCWAAASAITLRSTSANRRYLPSFRHGTAPAAARARNHDPGTANSAPACSEVNKIWRSTPATRPTSSSTALAPSPPAVSLTAGSLPAGSVPAASVPAAWADERFSARSPVLGTPDALRVWTAETGTAPSGAGRPRSACGAAAVVACPPGPGRPATRRAGLIPPSRQASQRARGRRCPHPPCPRQASSPRHWPAGRWSRRRRARTEAAVVGRAAGGVSDLERATPAPPLLKRHPGLASFATRDCA